MIVLFLLGLSAALYPHLSRYYYSIEAKEEVLRFEQKRQDLAQEEVEERLRLAQAYNQTLDPRLLGDPFTEEEQQGIAEYARMLEVMEKIGHVQIPSLGEDLPIYAGTSHSVLQKGAGHLEGTSLPIGGTSTHTIITAHRGLPSATLFSNVDRLKIGDRFYLHNLTHTLAYEVDQILVVEPSDFAPILVVPGKDYATLLTCTPYMINSHRLLVRGKRIAYTAPVEEKPLATNKTFTTYKTLFYGTLLFLALVILLLLMKRRKKDQ